MRFDDPLLHGGLIALLLAIPGFASAIVIVPDQAPTINIAMELISECDIVLVRAGTYVEEIDTSATPLCFTLRSESGPEETIIVGGILTAHHEGSFIVTIEGFTIRDGVGISMSSGSVQNQVTIRNCVIVDNSRLGRPGVSANGGGIRLNTFGSLFPSNDPRIRIENCIIRGNEGARGGGLWFSHEARITGCVITDNLATGAGGGVYYDVSNGRHFVQLSTIAGNQSNGGGAGIHRLTNGSRTLAIQSVIVALNEGGYGIFSDGNPDSVRITCSDAWENSAGNYSGFPDPTGVAGNLSVDPLFCEPVNGNYQLHTDSPCANAPGCGLMGGLGVGCGVVGIEETLHPPASLRLAPNPSPSSIAIELGAGAGNPVLLVYDVLGRPVARLDSPSGIGSRAAWMWPVPGAERPAAGVYYFRVEDRGSEVATGRGVLLTP